MPKPLSMSELLEQAERMAPFTGPAIANWWIESHWSGWRSTPVAKMWAIRCRTVVEMLEETVRKLRKAAETARPGVAAGAGESQPARDKSTPG